MCRIDSVSHGKKPVSNKPFVNPSFPMPYLISHLSHTCCGKKKILQKLSFWTAVDKQWHNVLLKWTLAVFVNRNGLLQANENTFLVYSTKSIQSLCPLDAKRCLPMSDVGPLIAHLENTSVFCRRRPLGHFINAT